MSYISSNGLVVRWDPSVEELEWLTTVEGVGGRGATGRGTPIEDVHDQRVASKTQRIKSQTFKIFKFSLKKRESKYMYIYIYI